MTILLGILVIAAAVFAVLRQVDVRLALVLAAGVTPVTAGGALLLGSSIGGELLNPGAPELRTVSTALGVEATECVARVFPLLMLHLAVATAVFWLLSLRAEVGGREPVKP